VAGELVAGLGGVLCVVFVAFAKDMGTDEVTLGNKLSLSTLTATVALKTTTKITLMSMAIY
jgi:hypothetical protein